MNKDKLESFQWYDGPVESAIERSKITNSMLMVYIYGADEISTKMMLSLERNGELINNLHITALKVSLNSDLYHQFSAIYPVLIIPCTFLIGSRGCPLEVIGGYVDNVELMSKIEMAGQKYKADIYGEPDAKLPISPGRTSAPGSPIGGASASLKEIEEHGLNVSKLDVPSSSSTLQMIAKQQSGSQCKLMQGGLSPSACPSSEAWPASTSSVRVRNVTTTPESATTNCSVIIQFRFVDGTCQQNTFPSASTFSAVTEYVAQLVSGKSFLLSTSFPKRIFTEDDKDSSLSQLGLSPRAVIIVKLASNHELQRSFWNPIWGFFAIFTYIWQIISEFFYHPSLPATYSSTAAARRGQKQNKDNLQERRDGNIRRFTNKDDDDESATWNGNSTQQM